MVPRNPMYHGRSYENMHQLKGLLLVLFISMNMVGTAQSDRLNVMSYNIKFDDKRDSINNWDRRKSRVIGLLKYHQPDIIGTQEVLLHQLEDIQSELGAFKFVGVARDDGAGKGEYAAFFYDTTKLKVLKSGTFWLSKTPETPSKSRDAVLPRICTWAQLETKTAGKQFYLFNTHFDHVGEEARLESSKLIIQKINEMAEQQPVVLMGDFNFTPDAEPYDFITESLKDSRRYSAIKPYGPEATFNAFNFSKRPERRIDYVFFKGLHIVQHATLADSQDMSYPSNHFPVMAGIQFN